jgi:hypothetical protein
MDAHFYRAWSSNLNDMEPYMQLLELLKSDAIHATIFSRSLFFVACNLCEVRSFQDLQSDFMLDLMHFNRL